MGHVNQLPPVSMKSITDDCNSNASCSSDAIRDIAFYEFMDPPNQLESINYIYVI